MSRIEFFKVAYSKKDGRPVNDVVAQALVCNIGKKDVHYLSILISPMFHIYFKLFFAAVRHG